MMGIMDDELDIDTAHSKEDKDGAVKAKASKIWRTLRLSSRAKLGELDKIEDGKNLRILFESPQAADGPKTSAEGEGEQEPASGEQKLDDSSPKEVEATEIMAS